MASIKKLRESSPPRTSTAASPPQPSDDRLVDRKAVRKPASGPQPPLPTTAPDTASRAQSAVAEYLNAVRAKRETSLDAVTAIVGEHLRTFAFSTLSANVARNIELDVASLIEHLLHQRSGLCLHHNIAMWAALKSLGFQVSLIACTFRSEAGSATSYPVPTHAAVILTLAGQQYLVDPGAGLAIALPLPLPLPGQTASNAAYRIYANETHFTLQEAADGEFRDMYDFDTAPRNLADFDAGKAELTRARHPFFGLFLHTLVAQDGAVLKIVNRTFVRQHDGRKQTSKLSPDALATLMRTSFAANAAFLEDFTPRKFINPELAKIVFD